VIQRSLVVAATFILGPCLAAQEQENPEKMLGFLKPGMRIGVRYDDNRSSINVSVLSDGVFKVLSDAKTLSPLELVEKHPAAKEGYEKHIETVFETKDRDKSSDNLLSEIGDREFFLSQYHRLAYPMTVTAVGEDYFVGVSGYADRKKFVYAQRFIRMIDWLDTVEFTSRARRNVRRLGMERLTDEERNEVLGPFTFPNDR